MNVQSATGITRQIAGYVTATDFGDLPAEAINVAKRCVIDGSAVMLAGSSEPCAEIVRTYIRQVNGASEARTAGAGSLKAPPQLAALANGVAGHALDWDDTALSLEKDRSVLIHPTMQPLCACYALADLYPSSGRDFLTAFILGFEIEVKIAEAINPEHFAGGRGFHSSGTIGIFGATVAAGKLMRLSEQEMLHALAIAATMAAGLGVNHGTMSKPLNMGRATENGVTAARLARLGFDGPSCALEGGRGFFEAFGGGFDPERLAGRLGAPFAILTPGTSIKPYPSGVVGHPGMDAMKELVIDYDIDASMVDSIHVRTGPNVIAPGPLRIQHATSALEAKFCVPFQMAAMVLRRKAGLEEFSDDFAQSDVCQSLQRRVTAEIDPEIAALGKDKVVFEIELVTTDGSRFHRRSGEHYRGGPKNPLTFGELAEKFEDCARALIDDQGRARFLSSVRDLDNLSDASVLLDPLTA